VVSAMTNPIPTEKPVKQSNEQRYYDALKRIAKHYDTAENLLRDGETGYGLSGEETLQYAYENIQGEAACAIRGKRRPKV